MRVACNVSQDRGCGRRLVGLQPGGPRGLWGHMKQHDHVQQWPVVQLRRGFNGE